MATPIIRQEMTPKVKELTASIDQTGSGIGGIAMTVVFGGLIIGGSEIGDIMTLVNRN
jgi:hypothetical protein